jgi:uncharacterized membrane protein
MGAIRRNRVLRFEALEKRELLATFQGLGFLPGGFAVGASAISADGSTIVGGANYGNGTKEAFRWTSNLGWQGLGDLPDALFYSEAYGVSADGSTVVGEGFNNQLYQNFRWTINLGMQSLGTLRAYSLASGVSADGSIVVGTDSDSDYTHSNAFRWTANLGIQHLGMPPGYVNSSAAAVSGDGTIIAGTAGSSGNEAVRWIAGLGMQGLGFLPGYSNPQSSSAGISSDGTTVVGAAGSPGFAQAFRWTADTGMQPLGFLPGYQYSFARAVSGDGSVVVGTASNDSPRINEAFLWTSTEGIQSIRDLLSEAGIDMTGWTLQGATGISADGSIIVGGGINPAGKGEAWIATFGADIVLKDATTRDFRNYDIKYDILNNDVDEFKFAAYLSTDGHTLNGPKLNALVDTVANASDRTVTNGTAHSFRLQLSTPAQVTKGMRFVVIKADADDDINESDEETNNTLFAIPLFSVGTKGGFLANGQFEFGGLEAAKAGANSARISTGTQDFTQLITSDLRNVWAGIAGTFPLPDPAPYAGDDWLAQSSVVEPLERFTALLSEARAAGRLPNGQLYLNEAFDEEGDHRDTSAHYEGRAIDVQFEAQNRLESQERLTGIAILAGFDWVENELSAITGTTHVHASVRGQAATATVQSLLDALNWGANQANPRLITDNALYTSLRDKLITVKSIAEGGPLDRDARRLISVLVAEFQQLVRDGTGSGKIRQGFRSTVNGGGLLIANASRLLLDFRSVIAPSGLHESGISASAEAAVHQQLGWLSTVAFGTAERARAPIRLPSRQPSEPATLTVGWQQLEQNRPCEIVQTRSIAITSFDTAVELGDWQNSLLDVKVPGLTAHLARRVRAR